MDLIVVVVVVVGICSSSKDRTSDNRFPNKTGSVLTQTFEGYYL